MPPEVSASRFNVGKRTEQVHDEKEAKCGKCPDSIRYCVNPED